MIGKCEFCSKNVLKGTISGSHPTKTRKSQANVFKFEPQKKKWWPAVDAMGAVETVLSERKLSVLAEEESGKSGRNVEEYI